MKMSVNFGILSLNASVPNRKKNYSVNHKHMANVRAARKKHNVKARSKK